MNKVILLFLGLISCSRETLEEYKSPSGQYSLLVELGNRNNAKDKYILMFKLVNKDKDEIDYVRTGASDVMKWAVIWYNEKTIILDSHDIGTLAWTVGQDGKMTELEPVTKDMIDKGVEVFKKKYSQ